MSGTELAAGAYVVGRHCPVAIAIFFSSSVLVFVSGCGASSEAPMTATTTEDLVKVEIDAGVIFSDRANYHCIPLSRFGLTGAEKIETIVSSCECVKPSLVKYADSSTTTVDGVLFEFIPDEGSPNTPMGLGVLVTLTLVGGETRSLTLSLLHTSDLSHRSSIAPTSAI